MCNEFVSCIILSAFFCSLNSLALLSTCTFLLNPLRVEVHTRLTPEHATAVYLLMFS